MQTICEIANKHTYKIKKGGETDGYNVIPNKWENIYGFYAWKTLGFLSTVHELKS